MAHLPPVTWNEAATQNDLRTLETVLTADMRTAISTATERKIRWTVTFDTPLVAVALRAARPLF